MSDLGQQLKEARLSRGLSLDDVQEMTKIRKRYLEAIEAGDYKVLPGSFYVRAFIKTYAEAVGVDPDELLNEHKQHVPDVAPEPAMEPVLQKRRSSRTSERNSKWLSTTLMWSFAVLILVVIYMYFTVWGKGDEAKDNQPDQTPVTDVSKGNNGNAGQNGSDQGTTNEGTTGNDDGTGMGNAGDGTNGGNDETGGDDTNTGTESGSVVVTPDGKDGSTTKFLVQGAGSQPVQVVITSTGKSWVEVRKGDKNGEKLFFDNTSENGGDVLNYELGPEGLFIKSGASSKTTITVGDQVVTDGKNTSKIQLNLGSADAGTINTDNGTSTDNTTTDGTNADGTGTNAE
ncbi:cytoskeleton protein RodZ [Fontibacillus phaseoli]|uniref:Cytoskeleton protein RodZ n=1 Tax=Fontibacillus phaseoli TaxID=1416533 RepID=A0A369AWV3_9BACL|nr:RodZ family helix-turn-helix domain-containing protein [Fontibacillus phaseoli]RCX12697.1 cytoskeleton protein RodZ [Fontibacillus phaseoli]